MKSTFIKLFAGLTLIFVLFSAVACTPANDPTATGTAEPSATKEVLEVEYSYEHLDRNDQFNFYEATATYEGADHTFLFRVPRVDTYSESDPSMAAKMDKQINTLNAMAASDVDVNVWVYIATALEDSEIMIDIVPTEYKGTNLKYFEENLSDDVWLGYVDFDNIKEYNEKYFTTDHHWNALGMREAYEDIVAGLKTKYDDITANEAELVVTDAQYYGSLSRSVAKYEYKDTFAFHNYKLPTHETDVLRVDNDDRPTKKYKKGGKLYYGSPKPFEDNIEEYVNGEFNTNDRYDHYVNFYPICDEVRYTENNTGRNCIFIGDSFSLGLQELVASHFDTTYYFYSDGTVNLFKNVDFNAFCEENNITDVMVIEQSTRLLYDFYDYSGPALCSFVVK